MSASAKPIARTLQETLSAFPSLRPNDSYSGSGSEYSDDSAGNSDEDSDDDEGSDRSNSDDEGSDEEGSYDDNSDDD
ncbi:hypothetical protein PG993_002601 [Apiospora rasikravindrae]|uniref:Uncharacterized protein n=1 Tax=Apiospora rasikravindrae TaxID=990691 RepID=A0ABR1TZA7_9PEZI